MTELLNLLEEVVEFLPEYSRRWNVNYSRQKQIMEKAERLEADLRRMLTQENNDGR